MEQKAVTNEVTISLTEALAANGVPLTAAAAHRVLEGAGMLEGAWRVSSKADREPVRYRIATALGHANGIVNEPNEVRRADPIIVRFVPSKFAALWSPPRVQDALHWLIREQEIAYRKS
ncbi:hypothetical protein [Trinickia dinghuensis]|uniref:Uncharacterized protein n=1 Tax=Trinickia dinghuensis TaxID=2291023 RepID=A0A3D8JPW6_9BURK|nr:hypothetical protein [Trinickia dinghuensis]RDU95163.1 hypothetical protein DWV00_29645 [Trinickia dinghuensis]